MSIIAHYFNTRLTGGDRSIGIVRLRTKNHGVFNTSPAIYSDNTVILPEFLNVFDTKLK
jgi:hypothetical protein